MLSLAALSLLLPFALAVPLTTRATAAANVVPNSYMVVLKADVGLTKRATNVASIADQFNPSSTFEIGKFAGFAADLSDDQITSLKADSRVCMFILERP
jgi:hypothetical protein